MIDQISLLEGLQCSRKPRLRSQNLHPQCICKSIYEEYSFYFLIDYEFMNHQVMIAVLVKLLTHSL